LFIVNYGFAMSVLRAVVPIYALRYPSSEEKTYPMCALHSIGSIAIGVRVHVSVAALSVYLKVSTSLPVRTVINGGLHAGVVYVMV